MWAGLPPVAAMQATPSAAREEEEHSAPSAAGGTAEVAPGGRGGGGRAGEKEEHECRALVARMVASVAFRVAAEEHAGLLRRLEELEQGAYERGNRTLRRREAAAAAARPPPKAPEPADGGPERGRRLGRAGPSPYAAPAAATAGVKGGKKGKGAKAAAAKPKGKEGRAGAPPNENGAGGGGAGPRKAAAVVKKRRKKRAEPFKNSTNQHREVAHHSGKFKKRAAVKGRTPNWAEGSRPHGTSYPVITSTSNTVDLDEDRLLQRMSDLTMRTYQTVRLERKHSSAKRHEREMAATNAAAPVPSRSFVF